MDPIKFSNPGKASETGTKSVEELKAEVQDRISQIHATQLEQSAYLSSDDIAELQKMENLLLGSLSLLEQFEKTGAMMPATTGIDTAGGPQLSSANMKVGWNGGYQSDTSDPNYDEVIKPFNQGTDVKNGLIFKMDDSMASVKAKNIGTDIEVTVTYKDPKALSKTYLLKGMVTNPTPLVVAADQTSTGVTVDFSQVKRVGGNITILGGSGDDTLIGSQGNDQIYGNAGLDTIYGLGGLNTLNGGAGSDEIYSVKKSDTVSGGEDYDILHAAEKDAAKAAKFIEETPDAETESKPVDEANFDSPDKSWKAEAKNGVLLVSKAPDTKGGGAINLQVPDGVMVYSKADGEDLVLTYQPIGDDGIPGTPQLVKIIGVLNSKSTTKITITSNSSTYHPSIIDLGDVNTSFNQVTLVKGQGDDVIIASKTAMDGYGIKADSIGKGSFDSATTEKINKAMEKDSKHHWATGDNGDILKDFPGWKSDPKLGSGEITLWPKDNQEVLSLLAPDVEGYTFLTSVAQESADKSETTLTLFMQKDGSKQVERLVLHIKKAGNNPKTITVGGATPHNADVFTKFIADEGDTGGGIFVGSKSSTDKSKAGKNKVIEE